MEQECLHVRLTDSQTDRQTYPYKRGQMLIVKLITETEFILSVADADIRLNRSLYDGSVGLSVRPSVPLVFRLVVCPSVQKTFLEVSQIPNPTLQSAKDKGCLVSSFVLYRLLM